MSSLLTAPNASVVQREMSEGAARDCSQGNRCLEQCAACHFGNCRRIGHGVEQTFRRSPRSARLCFKAERAGSGRRQDETERAGKTRVARLRHPGRLRLRFEEREGLHCRHHASFRASRKARLHRWPEGSVVAGLRLDAARDLRHGNGCSCCLHSQEICGRRPRCSRSRPARTGA